MTKQTLSGIVMVLTALTIAGYNMSDEIEHLKNWDGIWQPSFVGPALKAFLAPIVGALGGTLLPRPVDERKDA